MAEDKSKQPVIIKRIKKASHATHGGAWKIAYADFVTAMMAFFLLLWLLNSVTQEQLQGISNYFAPVSVSRSTVGSGGILGGASATAEGSAKSATAKDSVTMELPPPKAGAGGEQTNLTPDEEAAAEVMRQKEEEQFKEAKQEIENAIAGIPQLKQLADSLLIDNTPEGLRIQLLDKEGLPLFASGSADPYLHTKRLLELVSKVILKMPQQISISGHTDAKRFVSDSGYSNWELSSDRANAARRELVHFKVPYDKVSLVVGKAATEPLLPAEPENARNRRLSIILLRGTGKDNPANPDNVKARKKGTEEARPAVEAAPGKAQATVPPAPAAKPGDKAKAAQPLPPRLKATEGEALPGLDAIKRKQLEEDKAGGKPKAALPLPPKAKAAEGDALPGLEAIKRKQLEEDKAGKAKQ
jgi:chemotaxis protein MotB